MKSNINEIVGSLLQRQPLPGLMPKAVWNDGLTKEIDYILPGPNEDDDYTMAFKSTLYLMNEDLDKSHTLSQDLENETGSYLHSIMHRMEPDYSNAKYWVRQFGKHPIFTELQQKVQAFLHDEIMLDTIENKKVKFILEQMINQSDWDPILFIDAVQACLSTGVVDVESERILMKIQWIEMLSTLHYSYHKSCGGTLLESS